MQRDAIRRRSTTIICCPSVATAARWQRRRTTRAPRKRCARPRGAIKASKWLSSPGSSRRYLSKCARNPRRPGARGLWCYDGPGGQDGRPDTMGHRRARRSQATTLKSKYYYSSGRYRPGGRSAVGPQLSRTTVHEGPRRYGRAVLSVELSVCTPSFWRTPASRTYSRRLLRPMSPWLRSSAAR